MGMMLETVSNRLMQPGMPHHQCPDKTPKARLRTLETAGRNAVPFTTGLLIGIGETWAERVEALAAINDSASPARAHSGGDHPEFPGQAGDRHGRSQRAVAGRYDADARHGAADARSVDQPAGPAQSVGAACGVSGCRDQ
jgi:hypothetical protein